MSVPSQIAIELRSLIHHFEEFGYQVAEAKLGGAGSYYIRFTRDDLDPFELIKDKGEWMIGGDRSYLEPRGLFRAFSDFPEYHQAVITWFDQEMAHTGADRD